VALYRRTDGKVFYKEGVIYSPGEAVPFPDNAPPKSKEIWERVDVPAQEPAKTVEPPKKMGRAADKEPV
jgi:hypothetical protein